MKLKKTAGIFFSMMLSIASFAETRVGILNGPSCIPACYLIEKSDNYEFETFSDPQALLPKLLKNEIDIGFMPLNVAAKVYNSSGKKIRCIAVSGNGNLSIITKDKTLRGFSDLRGKTIYVAGMGSTPEYMFKYLLEKNNLSLSGNNSVTLDFTIPTAQLASQLLTGKIEYALVPEPFSTIASLKDKNVRYAIDLQEEYEELKGKGAVYPLTVIVVSSNFINGNENVIESFLEDYKKAVEWTKKNPGLSGKYCEKNKIGLSEAVVAASIPKAGYTFKTAREAKKECNELLEIFLSQEEKSIGGKLPDNFFYY